MVTATASPTAPITDLATWLRELMPETQIALRKLGELLTNSPTADTRPETAEKFTARCLEHVVSELVEETAALAGSRRITAAMALAELIAEHHAGVGPGHHFDPPAWGQTKVGETIQHHPRTLRAHFPVGTLLPAAACVVGIETRTTGLHDAELEVFCAPVHRDAARQALARIMARADELSPYRGRVLRASHNFGLHLEVIATPTVTRDSIVVAPEVWRELDLGITSGGIVKTCGSVSFRRPPFRRFGPRWLVRLG